MTSGRIGIIALVPEAWSQRWSTRHHVLTRLSELGAVVWVNPPHEWSGTAERFRAGSVEFSAPVPGRDFYVFTAPAWLPRLYRPGWLSRLLERWRFRRIKLRLHQLGCSRFVMSVWTPEHAGVLDRIEHEMSVYHIDDEYSFSEEETPVTDDERALLARATEVFVHSEPLLEKNQPYAKSISLTPNGVDYHLFAEPAPEPSDLQNIPYPRIGYAGFIKKQIDWELVLSLATCHPEWSFVMVGRRSPHPEIAETLAALEALPNTYFLGEKPTRDLAVYPQHFEVCIMPYRVNSYTKYINPLKLHEYLASGRPTIGPPIPSLQGVPEIELASTFDEWEAAIIRSLSREASADERVGRRQAVAQTMDWSVIVADMRESLRNRLNNHAAR